MEFEIKNLSLFNDLIFSKSESNPVMKTEELTVYTNDVAKNETNPDRHKYLTNGRWCGYGLLPGENLKAGMIADGIIPKGKYLFVQFFLETDNEQLQQNIQEAAAEALFLEALWQEITLDDTVYVRTLDEGGKKVCQLFRGTGELPD